MVHVLTLRGLEHVLLAVGDAQVAVGIDLPDIARVEPTVLFECLGSGFGQIMVNEVITPGPRSKISPSPAIFTSVPGNGQPTVPNR